MGGENDLGREQSGGGPEGSQKQWKINFKDWEENEKTEEEAKEKKIRTKSYWVYDYPSSIYYVQYIVLLKSHKNTFMVVLLFLFYKWREDSVRVNNLPWESLWRV